jgi:hypothetical protein
LLNEWQRKKPGQQGDDWWQQQQLQNLPTALNPYKSYYAFSMATVHFLMLDSESPSYNGSPQYNFVAQDLAKVRLQRLRASHVLLEGYAAGSLESCSSNTPLLLLLLQLDRSQYPWLVVGLHRMMAGPTVDPVNVNNMLRLQADFEDLFKQHAVDLVLQGHEHAYARTCPYFKGKCIGQTPDSGARGSSSSSSTLTSRSRTGSSSSSSSKGSSVLQVLLDPQAPVYVLAGHAGAGFTHAFPKVLPGWVVFGVQDQNGYLRVTVSGGKLTMVSVSTDDGHVIDGVQIVKKGLEAAASRKKFRQR